MEERVAVLAVRTAVDLHDQRVQLAGVQGLGLEQPALDQPTVGGGELLPLGFGDVAVVQPRVQVGEAGLRALGEQVELARGSRLRCGEGEHARRNVKVEYATLAAGLLADVPLQVGGVHAGHPRAAGQEVNAVAFACPREPCSMPGPHVVDDAVADRLVEVRGQASRAVAVERHDPESLQQSRIHAGGGEEGDEVASRRPRRRSQVKAPAEVLAISRQVDQVEVELELQVGAGLGVAGRDKPGAVGRPAVPRDIPSPARQLGNVAATRGHYEEVVIPAVDVALAVVLVLEPPHDPGNRRPADLVAALGRSRVVHHRFRVREDRADEPDPASVRRPLRAGGAFGDRAELASVAGGEVEHEQLVGRADPADERQPAAVRGPFGRVVSPRAAGGLDRLGLEQPADDDAASVLS